MKNDKPIQYKPYLQRTAGKLLYTIIAVALISTGCSQDNDTTEQPDMAPVKAADLVVINADVRTVDPVHPRAEAFAIEDGRFTAIGLTTEIQGLIGAETRVIDAGGSTVVPGLIDGHVHLTSGVDLVRGVNLYGIENKSEWLDKIAQRSEELDEGEWVVGGRWDHTLTDSPLPTKADLDAVVAKRPVFLSDVDGHSGWANSIALELAGIDADTPSPSDGVIMKDPETGEPTGILLEGAKRLVSDSPAYREGNTLTEEKRLTLLADTLAYANSLGLTSAHDMSGIDTFYDYKKLLESDALTLRIWYGFFDYESDLADYKAIKQDAEAALETPAIQGIQTQFGPMLALGYVKYVIDGVLSTYTASLLEPYSDKSQETGLPMMSQDTLNARVLAANMAGFPVAIHAIGDRGVRMAMDAFAASSAKPALMNRIEHIEMIHTQDLERFARENVIASMNPHHAVTTFHNYLTQRISEQREPTAYAWKMILDTGAHFVLGSDWATAPLNPFEQLWSATFRESSFGKIEGAWHPENALSFEEALHGYTQGAADAAGWGNEIGSITTGKRADFVIIDRYLGEPVSAELRQAKPRATYIGGRAVYEDG